MASSGTGGGAIAIAAAAAPGPRCQSPSITVTGAGSPGVDGCYDFWSGPGHGIAHYDQNGGPHSVYMVDGVWRVGINNAHLVNVSYVERQASRFPPTHPADWFCGGYLDACPAPKISGGAPFPPPAPPSPPTPAYPVATDTVLDCAVRTEAWRFAQELQGWRGGLPGVFDALRLSALCGMPQPTSTVDAASTAASAALSSASHAPGSLVFYADALHGDDSGAGDHGHPFATLHRGVAACRQARARDVFRPDSKQPRTCVLYLAASAPFVLDTTLALTPADSHLALLPMPSSAGPAPVITGGAPLVVPDSKRTGAGGGGGVWQPHNITPPFNIWKAQLPPAAPTASAVYARGKRAVRARWPNCADPDTSLVPEGYTRAVQWLPHKPRPDAAIISQPNATRSFDHTFPNWVWGVMPQESPPTFDPPAGYWMHPTPKGGSTYNVPGGLVYDAGAFSPRAKLWKNASTGAVHAFHGMYWGNWVFEIAAHNASNSTVIFGAGGSQEARGWPTGGAFFVDNIEEELDYPGEYFINPATREVLFFANGTAGTPPQPGDVAVASLEVLVSITGTSSNPVSNVTLSGITFTGTHTTYLSKPFRAPSGGDWSFAESAALVVEGAAGFELAHSTLHELGGNGLLLRGYSRGARVTNNTFRRLGDSGIVTCGNTRYADLSALDVPAGTLIEGNIFAELGVEVKQSGGLYSALSANHTVRNNVFYNLPRAAININDGAHGGHLVERNLFFNCVRETGDHGAFNSWDREPYVQTWRPGARDPKESHIRNNFLLNGYYGIHSLDHDDGSNSFTDTANVIAYAGMKNFLGFDKNTTGNLFVRPDYAGTASDWLQRSRLRRSSGDTVPLPRAYYFPVCARSLGQAPWGAALADVFAENMCILNTSGSLYEYGSCDPVAPGSSGKIPTAFGNTVWVPGGANQSTAWFKCGSAKLTLPEAQRLRYELGSSSKDSTPLTPEAVVAMMRQTLTRPRKQL